MPSIDALSPIQVWREGDTLEKLMPIIDMAKNAGIQNSEISLGLDFDDTIFDETTYSKIDPMNTAVPPVDLFRGGANSRDFFTSFLPGQGIKWFVVTRRLEWLGLSDAKKGIQLTYGAMQVPFPAWQSNNCFEHINGQFIFQNPNGFQIDDVVIDQAPFQLRHCANFILAVPAKGRSRKDISMRYINEHYFGANKPKLMIFVDDDPYNASEVYRAFKDRKDIKAIVIWFSTETTRTKANFEKGRKALEEDLASLP